MSWQDKPDHELNAHDIRTIRQLATAYGKALHDIEQVVSADYIGPDVFPTREAMYERLLGIIREARRRTGTE